MLKAVYNNAEEKPHPTCTELLILGIWFLLATIYLDFESPEKFAHFHWVLH